MTTAKRILKGLKPFYYSMLFFGLPFAFLQNTVAESDSLVIYTDLHFNSEFEEKYYSELLYEGTGAYEVLMSVNQRSDAKGIGMDKMMLKNEINKLKSLPKPRHKKNKYIKNIYSSVHDRFLKKYELRNYFNEVFHNGAYNCVSACALYAMVFDEMNIHYVIKETPNHVYIVAEPKVEQFLIETTDPRGGFNNFSQNFKSDFVNTLGLNKIISQSELASQDVNTLFSKYYFTNTDLSLKELVGLQYLNDGVFKAEDDDFIGAIQSFRKSYMLYPNDKTTDMLFLAITTQLNTNKYKNFDQIKLYGSLSSFDNKYIKDEELYNEFLRLTQQILVDEGKALLYDSAFQYLSETVKRKTLQADIQYAYNYERGRILFNRGKYRLALKFIAEAYKVKPHNVDVESLFLSSLAEVIESEEEETKRIEMLENVVQKHDNIMENNLFGGVYLNTYLLAMANAYESKKLTLGQTYQTKFERTYESNPQFKVEKELIGHAYSKLAVYYFRRGQYTNARRAINKGLGFVPNNAELLARRRMMNY